MHFHFIKYALVSSIQHIQRLQPVTLHQAWKQGTLAEQPLWIQSWTSQELSQELPIWGSSTLYFRLKVYHSLIFVCGSSPPPKFLFFGSARPTWTASHPELEHCGLIFASFYWTKSRAMFPCYLSILQGVIEILISVKISGWCGFPLLSSLYIGLELRT